MIQMRRSILKIVPHRVSKKYITRAVT
jgi:hypothetical protein